MPPKRTSRTSLALAAVALLTAATTACGDAAGLRGAGATPTAISPVRLWPDLPPASSPAFDIGEVDTEVVKGLTVPGDDIRKVDPITVVRAEIAASPGDYSEGAYEETARRMDDCGKGGTGAGALSSGRTTAI